jgi:hypothetical protein
MWKKRDQTLTKIQQTPKGEIMIEDVLDKIKRTIS